VSTRFSDVSTRFSDGFVGETVDRDREVVAAPALDSRGAGANATALGFGVGDSCSSHEQRLRRPLEAAPRTVETDVVAVAVAAVVVDAHQATASEETATLNWPLDSPLVSAAGLDRELRRGRPASFEELAEAFSSAEHKSLFEHDMFAWDYSKSSPVGVGAPPRACNGKACRGRGEGGGGGGWGRVRRQRGASVENISVEVKTDVAYYTVLHGGGAGPASGGRDQPWMGMLDGGGKNPSVVVVGELAFFEANGKGEPSTTATGTLTAKKSSTAYMKNAPGELKDDVFVYDEDQLSREIEAARSPSQRRSERRGHNSSSIVESAPRSSSGGGGGGGAMDAERLKALQESGVGFLCDAARLDG
ncbi:unnamed protein product, partial [Laminaria digitata]